MDNLKIVGDVSALEFLAEETVKYQGKGLDLRVEGQNNRISVGKGVVFNGFSILIQSNNNQIEIGDGCRLTGNVVMKIVDGNSILIGEKTSVGGANFICGEGTKISIGKDCMIAWNIEFRSTDSHAIIETTTGKRINPAKDIAIEDHVWIGAHSTILKGSRVKKNSVVSIKSLVNKDFSEENVVLAGVPAKIVKRDITWERQLLG